MAGGNAGASGKSVHPRRAASWLERPGSRGEPRGCAYRWSRSWPEPSGCGEAVHSTGRSPRSIQAISPPAVARSPSSTTCRCA